MALTPCVVCGVLTNHGGSCQRHARNGSTRQWRNVRAAVIARDGGCSRCGTLLGLHAHHIRARAHGGAATPENLEVLCERCHRAEHSGA